MTSPGLKLIHRLRRYLCLAICVVLPIAAHADKEPEIVTRAIAGIQYDLAREALQEAIAAEGLASPVISYFADMLSRTAGDLGHRADLYRDAHIYTFCTVAAAAQLASESPVRIALCPLSIAVYQLADAPEVHFAYRPSGLDSVGGKLASLTQARILARTLDILGLE